MTYSAEPPFAPEQVSAATILLIYYWAIDLTAGSWWTKKFELAWMTDKYVLVRRGV